MGHIINSVGVFLSGCMRVFRCVCALRHGRNYKPIFMKLDIRSEEPLKDEPYIDSFRNPKMPSTYLLPQNPTFHRYMSAYPSQIFNSRWHL